MVASVVASCAECGGALNRRRPHGRFCSDRCRWVSWKEGRQARLDLTPAPEPVQRLDSAPAAIRAPQKGQAVRVLEMLKIGPCKTGDFLAAGIGRFGARIAELRAVGWNILSVPLADHAWLYSIDLLKPEGD